MGIVVLTVSLFQAIATLVLIVQKDNLCRDAVSVWFSTSESNNTSCTWDWGVWVGLVGIVLWFLTGLVMAVPLIQPLERPNGPRLASTQTVTYTQSPQPDGNVVVTCEVVKGTFVPNDEIKV